MEDRSDGPDEHTTASEKIRSLANTVVAEPPFGPVTASSGPVTGSQIQRRTCPGPVSGFETGDSSDQIAAAAALKRPVYSTFGIFDWFGGPVLRSCLCPMRPATQRPNQRGCGPHPPGTLVGPQASPRHQSRDLRNRPRCCRDWGLAEWVRLELLGPVDPSLLNATPGEGPRDPTIHVPETIYWATFRYPFLFSFPRGGFLPPSGAPTGDCGMLPLPPAASWETTQT